MLFDLRSRGRRRTVQVIYLGLALLMLFGLVLFGVGAGNGFGGLLNAFTNNGSSNGTQVVSQQLKTALKATKDDPSSAQAWGSLVQAQYIEANEGTDFNSTSGVYDTDGKRMLADATQSWQRYLSLTQTPSADVAILAARAYAQLAQYAGEANAWESYTLSQPNVAKGYECLAAAAYAAKQTRKAQLAAAKAISLAPEVERLTLKQELEAAKTSPLVAQEC
jgi:hypothetical protein